MHCAGSLWTKYSFRSEGRFRASPEGETEAAEAKGSADAGQERSGASPFGKFPAERLFFLAKRREWRHIPSVGPVAQLVEPPAHNRIVVGSKPAGSTTFYA